METVVVWRLSSADNSRTCFFYDEHNAKATQMSNPTFTNLVKEEYSREVWEAFCDMMDHPPKEWH